MMKLKILRLSLVALMFAATTVGCQDENDLFELQIGDENAVIQKKVDGIEFKFCLLNEQGESATIFSEGENFTFLFAIKNRRSEHLPFYDYGYYELNDFLTVKSDEKSYGRPFLFKGYNPTKELRWLRTAEDYSYNYSYNFMVPWHDKRDQWKSYWGFFESTKQPYLKKGKYFTQFAYNFSFGMPGKEPELETGLITFKINFEIK